MGELAERLSAIDEKIADAARAAGRDVGEITRIVVTKFHPVSLVRELYSLGVRDVGENRQQELSAKREEIADDLPELCWHFIGQAQTKKAGAIRRGANTVHSVDRDRLADALDRAGQSDGSGELRVLDVLLQVNLTQDEGRGGVRADAADELAEHILGLPSLRLRGVMGVAPLDEAPAAAFERLRGVSDSIRSIEPNATWISAGMTGDFAEAVSAGATHLRIGSAITGPRPDRG